MAAEPNRARDLFLQALELATPEERDSYLRDACAADPGLHARVAALLQAHEKPDSVLDHPAAESAPTGDNVRLDFLTPSTKKGSLGRLGQYEVLDIVGRGGMGIVLRAFDEKLHRIVAIKVLAPHLADNGESRRRFVREARAAAAVTHDHVIGIYAVEEEGPVPYLVMQFVSGRTLQAKLDQVGPLPLQETLRIGLQLAEGLAAAQRQGLIHRDIKPANILLENGIERVRITDFGLARAADDVSLTQSGVVAGTPEYMSPEQAEGERVDHRSDLYSFGSVLYALCAGHSPFQAKSSMALLRRVCGEAPPPLLEINPATPQWLELLVLKLLAKKPAERFASATEVATILSQRLAELQSGSEPVGKIQIAPAQQPLGRTRLIAAGILIALLAAVTVGVREFTKTPPVEQAASPSVQPPPETNTGPVDLKPLASWPGHTDGIVSVAYSLDGRTIASAGKDRSIRLWDATTGQPRVIPTDHPGMVIWIVFSPDSSKVASITNANDSCCIRLWDVATAKSAGTLGGAAGGMWGLDWSRDGKLLACGGYGRTLHVFDVSTSEEVKTIPNANERLIRALGFSPNGDRVITGGGGATRLWDVKTGKAIESSFPPEQCPSILPNGEVMAAWSFKPGTITLCDVPSGKFRSSWKAEDPWIDGIAVSADGRFVASVSPKSAHVWSIDGSKIATLVGNEGSFAAAAYAPDGSRLVTVGDNASVRLWDLPAICRVRK